MASLKSSKEDVVWAIVCEECLMIVAHELMTDEEINRRLKEHVILTGHNRFIRGVFYVREV